MSSVITFLQKSKWFSIMLILIFVGNGVLGQASVKEQQATKKKLMKYLAANEISQQLTTCCPEFAKDIDPEVCVEAWMVEENFGLSMIGGEKGMRRMAHNNTKAQKIHLR